MDNIKLHIFDFPLHRVFFIVLITSVIMVPAECTTDRSFILKNFMKLQNQREDALKHLIPCAATFIEKYFEYPDHVSFLLPDALQDIFAIIEPLMNELSDSTSAIYTLNNSLLSERETHDALTNVVILLDSGITLETNDSSFINYCEHDCQFIMVLTNLFTDKESFLIEAATLVQQMSLQSIFKLEILASVGDSVLHASSSPIRINESYTLAEPTFSSRCEQQATVIQWQYFDETRSSDSNVINVGMFDNLPFSFIINDMNYLTFGGIEGSMVEEIARSMKIKLNRETIEWMHETSNMKTEIYLRFYNATDDLVFGGLLWDFSRKVTYTTCYGMVHVSWIIPLQTNVSLRGLIAPFDANIWYTIICALIVGGLIKLFFIREITFLDIAALVFGVSTYRQPRRTSSRIQFISWAIFGFFLTQIYLGSLADHLISTSDMQMETREELVHSGLTLGGSQRLADLLKTPDTDMDNYIDQMIRDKFCLFNQKDYHDQLSNIIEGKNDSLALLVMLNLTNNPSNIGHAHIIKETVGTYPLAFVTRQNFPYLQEFNFKIQVLVQAGLVEYWSNMALNNKKYAVENEEDNNSLDIADITPAFLLLIMGYLGGFCLLIIEVIFYPSKWLL